MSKSFDLIIKNARVLDGLGNPATSADVGIKDGRFAAVEPGLDGDAPKVLDAGGNTLAPGFIDIHSHADMFLMLNPGIAYKLRQGVTTEVSGNCGMSVAPLNPQRVEDLKKYVGVNLGWLKKPWQSFGDYGRLMDESQLGTHAACMVGHGTIRAAVMGFDPSPPSAKQLDEMKELLAQALDDGAVAMSSGLIYPPGVFAKTEELVELCKVVKDKGAFYATHIRNETFKVLEAIEEALEIGRRSGARVHISHLKIMGPPNWKLAPQMKELLQKGAQELELTGDFYPYLASSTNLLTLLPDWCLEGGMDACLKRLDDPALHDKVIEGIDTGRISWIGYDKVMIARVKSERSPQMEGRSLSDLAAEAGLANNEFVIRLLLEEEGIVSIISHAMDQKVQSSFIKLPFVMFGSDGLPRSGKPHPRAFGTFPRAIAHHVRALGDLTLEDAVRKMTSLPAKVLGLKDRGVVAPGYMADAVVFDPDTFADKATYENPRQHPVGLKTVLMDGVVALEDGEPVTRDLGNFLTPSA
jgi:N-acyl-D-amino-acid deacylase